LAEYREPCYTGRLVNALRVGFLITEC
jgi:hypothetical protein